MLTAPDVMFAPHLFSPGLPGFCSQCGAREETHDDQLAAWQERFGIVAAHLPGQHDQQSHGNRGGSVSRNPHVAELQRILDTPYISTESLGMGADGAVFLVRHEGGTVVRKQFNTDDRRTSDNIDREILAAEVAAAAGFPNAGVRHPTRSDTVFLAYHEGAPIGFSGDSFHDVRSPDGARMAMLDMAIWNEDRHNGNWLRAEGGGILPIDHSRTFDYYEGGFGDASFFNSPFAQTHFSLDVTPEGLTGIRTYTVPQQQIGDFWAAVINLGPTFAEAGHSDWFDDMMRRVDMMYEGASR